MNDHNRYTSTFKQNVLKEYRPGVYGCGFKPLAKRFKIKDDHKLIMKWYRQLDGTVQSFNRRSKGGRPRTLTPSEVKHYVLDFLNMMNSQYEPVNYRMVQSNVEASLNKMVLLSTLQRYGKEECGLKWKKIREIPSRDSRC